MNLEGISIWGFDRGAVSHSMVHARSGRAAQIHVPCVSPQFAATGRRVVCHLVP